MRVKKYNIAVIVLLILGTLSFQTSTAMARDLLKEFIQGIDLKGKGSETQSTSQTQNFITELPASKQNSKTIAGRVDAVESFRVGKEKLNNRITVSVRNEKARVNRLIFGNNLLGYDPAEVEASLPSFLGYKFFGGGIWDPRKKEPVPELVSMAQEAGITVLRFPGGCGAHHYDWKKAVGQRSDYLFGINEFLLTAKAIAADRPVAYL